MMTTYTLPELRFGYDELEPHCDAATLELHHQKHHQSYVDGLNKAVAGLADARRNGDFGAVKHLERELAFHGNGHALHSLFWEVLTPDGGGRPEGNLGSAIDNEFGSFEAFNAQFRAATAAVEGSGWGMLAVSPSRGTLTIAQIEKHQNQMLAGWEPILVVDVWEHAYYLTYQNRRAEFIDAVMDHLVDWDAVRERYERLLTA
jgi:Fe-Mn family superoxide dismutase